MKKLILVILLAAFVLVPVGVTYAASCGGWFEPSCNNESMQTQTNQEQLGVAVPLPILKSSLERQNIKKRLELWSDESKVSYIYLISYGRVMAFYTVKGKITSGQKRPTSNQRIIDANGIPTNSSQGNGSAYLSDAPELDGTYGSSSPYIFFWTTDGTYVQWSGEYMLADQPLKLTTQPELVRDIK